MKAINFRIFGLLMFLSISLFGLDYLAILNPVKGQIESVLAPVEYGMYSIRTNLIDSISFIGFWRSGEARIRFLEQKNWEYVSQLVELSKLKEENKSLREQLGVQSASKYSLLAAPVLGFNDGMVIGLGKEDGVRIGMTVTYTGHLIGRVVKLLPKSAVVMLPIDSGSSIPVRVEGIEAVVTGQFGTGMVLEKISQIDKLTVDSLVVTSGEGQTYVPGMVVGKVLKISGRETDLFRKADVKSFVDYSKLTTVFLIR